MESLNTRSPLFQLLQESKTILLKCSIWFSILLFL